MIRELFDMLYKSLHAAPQVAILGSIIWGILSILLSPCHLASIPLIIGFIDEQGKISTKRAFWISLLFSTGILVTIGLLGIITALLGRMLGDIGRFGNYFVAIIFFIIGLHLLEIMKLPFLSTAKQPGMKKKGLLAAFLIGLIFGIALGPCTFAYMAPMLGVAFSVSSKNIIFSITLVFAYAIGHCSVIVFAGTFTELVQNYLNWSEKSKGTTILKKICGILVILGGIYVICSKF